MKPIKWLDDHLEEVFLVFMLVLICLVMLAQVIARYIFNSSMSWPEEFCRYCYVWSVFISLGYTIRRGNMLRVGVVMDLFPAKLQSVVRIVVHCAMIYLFARLLMQSFTTVDVIKNRTRELSSAMQFPMWIMYMSTTIGFALAIFRTIEALIKDFARFNIKEETTTEATIKEAQAEAAAALSERGGE